ncbi:MAG: DEAD/DEAH box helicase [Desulfurococcaceae archaeon]
MLRIISREILDKLGYNYIYKREEGVEPEYVDTRFSDIVPEFSSTDIGECKLYKHQYDGYIALRNGFNVILKSGTGSGKTEVWVLHGINEVKNNKRYTILALYPTLALANDQIKRINKYFSLIGINPLQIDSVKKEEYVSTIGRSRLRELINSSNIIISNPAFILHDLKKYFLKTSNVLLRNIYERLNLLVIDEIDFYGPRSLALLLGIIKLLSSITDNRLQVVVLTATLANPDDMGVFLREITGREYRVITGKPFSVENHVYIVLGKNIREIWNKLRLDRDKILSILNNEAVKEEVIKSIESFDYFTKNLYRLLSILSAFNYELPQLSTDPVEIISNYMNDDYVTIVFTNSISSAEEIVRSIKYRYGDDKPVASHHHLVPKKKREEIEEKARNGLLKLIVSPRTLSQGIDIGTVARIVHLGLPDDVRLFYQREGRKGRRREIVFSETVIIPYSRWDRELLSRGLELFEKWLKMGCEKVVINPDNLYLHLFTGVIKLRSPWFRQKLETREQEVLEKIGVLTKNGFNEKLLKLVFDKMNFYEYAPPYGIKRYLVKENELIPLESIGHCDLVEKFQPGNIDYSEEAIVTEIDTGRSTRYVKAVYEKPIREIDFYNDDALAIAYEEYRSIKIDWGEKPGIIKDILSGKLSSEELCVVYVPWNGFGEYRKIPDRCIWILRSEKPRIRVVDNEVIVYFDERDIYVPKPVAGEYRDYTYGYRYSVESIEKSDLMRLALAMIMILLRRLYGIAFETIMYDVIKIGEYKYFSLYEPESAGIIDKINWIDLRKNIEKYEFDDLDLILLSEIDDIAYSILISYDFNWDLVKQQMIRIVDYILAKDRIRLILAGRELVIPKPNPGLKKISLSIISEFIGEETDFPQLLVSLAVFNGDDYKVRTTLYPPIPYVKPPIDIIELEREILDRIIYENYQLIIDNRESVLNQLKIANTKQLVLLIENYSDKVVDLTNLARSKSFETISIDELINQLGISIETVNPARVREVLNRISRRGRIKENEREIIEKYVVSQALKNYYSYLILSSL